MTDPLPLDDELKERLVDELAKHGRHAIEWFDTAYASMTTNKPEAPRQNQTVAYSLRQAFQAINNADGAHTPTPWKDLARAVVKATEQYRLPAGRSPAGTLRNPVTGECSDRRAR